MFGLASMIVGLAIMATVPILQLVSLGYLLEVSGRIVRTGRVREGFIGIRPAARAGSIVLGVWLLLWPVRLVSSMATSARLIQPGSPADRGWSFALWALTLLLVLHVVGACLRGGRLRNFAWPAPLRVIRLLRAPGTWATARDATCDYILAMRLPYYFWLGLRGFVGGLIWLVVPVALLAAGQKTPPLSLLGGLAMVFAILYLPFAQTRFAAQGRFRALFELRPLRAWFRHAPWAFWLALLVTLALALPLYLLKIELIPRDAAWLPSILFVLFGLPSRLAVGWACSLGGSRRQQRAWYVRYPARLLMLPIAAAYVFITFFTQFTSWYGVGSLLEQHAFLLPAPFLGY